MSRRVTTTRLALTGALVFATAVSLIGIGAWATLTDTKIETTTVSAGTISLTLGMNGTSANRLAVGVTDMLPGDTMQRAIDITNAGSADWSTLLLDTTATSSSLLDTDATHGLQMTIDECSVAWTESGPPYVYTCSGTTTNRVASRAVIGTGVSLGTPPAAGATGHYRMTLALPTTSPSAAQGTSSTIDYSFTGTQRTGTAR